MVAGVYGVFIVPGSAAPQAVTFISTP